MVSFCTMTTTTTITRGQRPIVELEGWPDNDAKLWWWIWFQFGVAIPATPSLNPECRARGHVTPFSVFADTFFQRYPFTVVKASRGLAGKTFLAATLGAAVSVRFGGTGINPSTVILGGSLAQSQNAHAYTSERFRHADPLVAARFGYEDALTAETKTETRLNNGAIMRVVAADSRSVRGPHPPHLLIDEADEIKDKAKVYDAALGQPMPQTNIFGELVRETVIVFSTHHYALGTFTEILKEAAEKDHPVREWCYHESKEKPIEPDDWLGRYKAFPTMGRELVDGWLDDTTIANTKSRVPALMWETEYELQEPSFEGRAFIPESIEMVFSNENYEEVTVSKEWERKPDGTLAEVAGLEGVDYVFEDAESEVAYVTFADWARKTDYTVITTFRMDTDPWRCVAWGRYQRRPWPDIAGKMNERLHKYGNRKSIAGHDATGIGDVLDALLDPPQYLDNMEPYPFMMVGRPREEMLTGYTVAIEDYRLVFPRIESAYTEHLYCHRDDLYGKGPTNHPPDSVVSAAGCWMLRDEGVIAIGGPAAPGGGSGWKGPGGMPKSPPKAP